MYNNYYGKQKDGTILEYDPFMTIGQKGKWDFTEEGTKLRVFNPETNETIFTLHTVEIAEHFELEDIEEVCWDYVTEYVNSQCTDIITTFYKNKSLNL